MRHDRENHIPRQGTCTRTNIKPANLARLTPSLPAPLQQSCNILVRLTTQ